MPSFHAMPSWQFFSLSVSTGVPVEAIAVHTQSMKHVLLFFPLRFISTFCKSFFLIYNNLEAVALTIIHDPQVADL